MKIVAALWVLLLGSLGVFGQAKIPNGPEHIGLNSMWPDANRPVNSDFVNQVDHPVVAREDERRAAWMKNMLPRLLAIPGCEKVFLWVSMDEFEGGFGPDAFYGAVTEGQKVRQVDLWGIIAADRQWRKSAFALQEILK